MISSRVSTLRKRKEREHNELNLRGVGVNRGENQIHLINYSTEFVSSDFPTSGMSGMKKVRNKRRQQINNNFYTSSHRSIRGYLVDLRVHKKEWK